MHPIITKLGPITIYSYGMMVAIAFVLGIYVAGIEARRKGIKQDLVYDLMFYIVIGSLIAARFYYLAFFDPSVFIKSPLSIFKIWEGGVAIHGGILGGIIAGIVFSKLKKTSFWKLADLVAPSIILGQAIGRIGCFLNGCCFGVPTESIFGVRFPLTDVAVHPTQLYELVLNSIGFFILWSVRKKIKFDILELPQPEFSIELRDNRWAKLLDENYTKDEPLKKMPVSIDVRDLKQGVYFIRVISGESIMVKKIEIKH